MKAFFSLIAYCLAGAGVLTAVLAGLNHIFDWNLGLAIGGFDIALLPDLGANLALACALLLLAAGFELASKPKKVIGWIRSHLALTAALLVIFLGTAVTGIMNLAGGPLGFAVEEGDTEKVRTILAEKAFTAEELNPHFYQALKKGRIDMARLLHEAGANVDHKSGEFETPLLSSSLTWFPREAVEQLLEWRPDPNQTDTMGRTPAILLLLYRSNNFSQESEDDRLAILQRLGELGADFTRAGQDGATPLSIARSRNQLKLVEYLESALKN